jgi:hypothetical protein
VASASAASSCTAAIAACSWYGPISHGEGSGDQGDTFPDGRPVPEPAVLPVCRSGRGFIPTASTLRQVAIRAAARGQLTAMVGV